MSIETEKSGIIRNSKGQIVKGSGSLNPGGNRGTNGLVDYIKGKYGENLEKLTDILDTMLLDGRVSAANKIKVIEMLFNRVYGQSKQTVDSNITMPEAIEYVLKDKNDTDTGN